MASTGYKLATSVYNNGFSGTSSNLVTDNDTFVYNSSTSTNKTAIVSGFDFSSIPQNATIVSCSVRIVRSAYASSSASSMGLSWRLVTDISNGSNSYTSLLNNPVSIPTTNTSPSNVTTPIDVERIVTWMNDNLSTVRAGTNIGIRLYGKYCKLYRVYISIEYEAYGSVLYDTEFDYAKWREKGITAGTGSISNITDTGFTMTANANDTYTGESHVFRLTEGQTYTIKYDTSGASSNECFVFYHSSETSGWNSFTNSTAKQFNFTVPSGYPYCTIRVDVNNSGQTITFSNFLIVKSSESWRLSTISSYTARRNTDSWSFPTATRAHYTFSGWKDANGTSYTSSSAYPSEDIVLYSQWTIDRHTISTAVSPSGSGSVSGGGTYNYGATATLTASPASGYTFLRWNDNSTANPRSVTVSSNATYTAYFEVLSKIFVGNNRASASYVGTAKAKAVYIGTTKVL